MFPFVSPAVSIAASVAASAASTAASAARTCLGRRAPQPVLQTEPDRLVPRYPALEQELLDLAAKMRPEGGIVITDRPDRVPAISFNFLRAIGLQASSKVFIMVAATTEAERAEVERLKAAGQLRPIFHDPAMPSYRQPKPVPPPESVEDLIAAQARDMRRRLKLEKKAARHERRCSHHADLIGAIEALPSGSSVLLVQSAAYGSHVGAMIRRLRPDLISPRIGIFIVVCPTAENEASALADRPDYTANLPVIRMPGLRLARARADSRQAQACSEAPASMAPVAPAATERTLEERLEVAERHIAGMLDCLKSLVGLVEDLHREAGR